MRVRRKISRCKLIASNAMPIKQLTQEKLFAKSVFIGYFVLIRLANIKRRKKLLDDFRLSKKGLLKAIFYWKTL
jgi:hypothetical protein